MKRDGLRRWISLPLTRRAIREREVDDEIRLHIGLRAQRLIDDGMSPEEAWRQAVDLFGGSRARQSLMTEASDRTTTMRTREELFNLIGDLRFIVRQLRRAPVFTAAAILTIALGVGANATMFAV